MGELLEKKRKRVVEGPKGRIQKGSISRKNTIKGSKSFHSEISMISKTKMVAIEVYSCECISVLTQISGKSFQFFHHSHHTYQVASSIFFGH